MTVMREDRQVALDPALAKKLKRAATMQSQWLRERDQLILEAHAAGASLREIGVLVGLSHVGVMKIVEKFKALDVDHIHPAPRDEPNLMILDKDTHDRMRGQEK